ncbi:50S ribosomal protein L25 [Candidatus Saccharibacteria bacterium]|nr:50S ribosomal protein L25 [Candidatus Saccharibacteria bacterium]
MSDNKLSLEKRTVSGKKVAKLRAEGLIPSVIYGDGNDPIMVQSTYNDTEKVLKAAGYHSTIDITIDKKPLMVIVKDIAVDPVSRKIVNVEFQAVSADKPVEAVTPIVITGFETSEANKLHYVYTQSIEEIEVKAKPADLPKELTLDASKLANLDDKLTIADLELPAGVELADKELSKDQVIASLYDPAAVAAQREAEEAAAKEAAAAGETTEAADVPSDNGSKPEEAAEGGEAKNEE